jgi:glycosyltransferase involved in cell wall biosynthesis
MNSRLIIFAPEFYPVIGGITEFTVQLAKALHRAGRLEFLYTLNDVKNDYEFDYMALDYPQLPEGHWKNKGVLKKIRSYQKIQKRNVYLDECFEKVLLSSAPVLINSLFVGQSWKLIKKCIAAEKQFIPLIHGLDIIENTKHRPEEFKEMIRQAYSIVVNSKATQKILIEYYPESAEKIEIIYPPFDKDEYQTNASELQEGKEGQELVVASICRLVKRKGIDKAIRGVAEALKQGVKVKYYIAGRGSESDNLKALISELQLEEEVVLLGEVTDKEKYELLDKADIFVMPNHTLGSQDFEGFGISFVEAQYFNNFVIAGKNGGAVESVSAEFGFHVDFDVVQSPEAQIGAQLVHLFNHPSELFKQQKGAKQFVINNFEISNLVQSLKEGKALAF